MNRKAGMVSVIIPCYNHGKYIHEAINSILDQTYKHYEIIVVDDGSDDTATVEILDDINNPLVRVYHKENGDVASARNFGIKKSLGEFILTLDADDKFAPEFLEKAVNVLNEHPKIGMVTSYVQRFGNDSTSQTECQGGELIDFLKKNQAVACLLFRFQCWVDASGYDEKVAGFEDWEFAISVTKQGWRVYSIPELLFYYRKVNGSMYVRVINKRPEIIEYIVNKHIDVFEKHLADVINSRELLIQSLKEELDLYKNSKSFKVGNMLLSPFRKISKI